MAKRGVNKVILIGHLGQDPEIRYMPNGNAVANMSLATSDVWKDKNTGDNKEKTEWHRIVLFGKLAEIAGEYLRKGSQVFIEGSLQTRKWQDQNGIDRYTTEIIVNMSGTMQMLGTRQNNVVSNNAYSLDDSKNSTKDSVPNTEVKEDYFKTSEIHKKNNKISKKEENISSNLDFEDDLPF